MRVTFYVNTAPFSDRADRGVIDDYFDRIRHGGDRRTLSSSQVAMLHRAGHALGCHTHTHRALSSLTFDEATRDIVQNREILEQLTDRPVRHLSFPFGMRRHVTAPLRAWASATGFTTVSNAIPGCLHGPLDPFNLYRTKWNFSCTVEQNLATLRVDGRFFAGLTGRSPVA